jgi:putative methionine-R-sulfoxide reductase with GAF domain
MQNHQAETANPPSRPRNFRERINYWLAEPSPSVTEVGARRQASLLSWLLVIFILVNTLGILSSINAQGIAWSNIGLIALDSLLLIVYGISRTKYYQVASYIFVFALVFLPLAQIYTDPEARIIDISFAYLPLAFFLGISLLSVKGMVVLALISSAGLFFFPILKGVENSTPAISALGVIITIGALAIATMIFRNSIERSRLDELRKANEELQSLQSGLEQRVEERTRALRTSAEVGQSLSQILDERDLVKAVVEQVQQAFGYYHVHIYLYDESEETLRMAGGTGEPGRKLLNQAHYLPKGKGLVGKAAARNNVVLVADTYSDPNWLPNLLLPETRSEIAAPIAIGSQVLGVIDVQQNQVNGLSEADADLLRSIASQVAIAIRNARAFATAKMGIEREALLGQLSLRLQTAPTIDAVLRVAVSELSQVLGADRGIIQVSGLHARQADARQEHLASQLEE